MNNHSTNNSAGAPGRIQSEASARSKRHIPQLPNEDDTSRFFRSNSRGILQDIVFHLASTGEEVTLQNIRQTLLLGPDAIEDMYHAVAGQMEVGSTNPKGDFSRPLNEVIRELPSAVIPDPNGDPK